MSNKEEPLVSDDLGEGHGGALGDPRAVVMRWVVTEEAEGVRADVYLCQRLRRLSRTRAQRIIRQGDFRTDHGPLKPSSRLPRGATLELWRLPPDEPLSDSAGPAPRVLHEDEALVVLDKPPHLAVHPTARHLHQTVTAWLRHRTDEGERIPNPCHRLDRETSGVLLCAKTRTAEAAAKEGFARGNVDKTYLAVVRGKLVSPCVIDLPLALQGERGLVKLRMVHDTAGLPSQTEVRPLGFDPVTQRSLVACQPKTGRQHQIRVHLALIGFPLVGDKLYAMGDQWFDAHSRGQADLADPSLDHVRHALHAYELSLTVQGRPHRF
ncbi:MAG: pseudouridine synthase, partial [Myxococcota bacterium]